MNPEKANTINGYWMPTVVIDKASNIKREDLQIAFAKENIDARVFFYPLSSLDFFESFLVNINASDIPNRAINLPSYYDITLEEQNRVIDVAKTLL